jgi:anti-sigma B factor antagonist
MHELKRLEVEEVGDVTVVRFRDPRITEDRRIEAIARELFHLVEEANCKKLLLSLASVDILSSAALGKLITLDKKAMARGSVLKLSNLSADVALVFSITRLDCLFDVAKDEETALAAFRDGASNEGVSAPAA